ncbi:MAG TPA: ATP-binding cassette domain-containing protein [Patescibacteria group bacterium]|nr:ATP-binding cassette domain-containing protein [Patescibacteria group bacterium]
MTKRERNTALSLHGLEVKRDSFTLKIHELELRSGEVTCIVGPNGCGKTTLLLTILGLLPHKGDCFVTGKPYDGTDPLLKAKIGFIPDDPELLFEELSAREQWSVSASVHADLTQLVNRAQLIERAETLARAISFNPPPQLARDYSHGMRKKTQIVDALVGQPQILIADELHNGLDPLAIKQAEELIQAECDQGMAVLAATHDLWWAERFAKYIYVLNRGRVIAAGTGKQLRKKGEPDFQTAFFRILREDS